LPGISGLPNNSVLFELDRQRTHEIEEVNSGLRIASSSGFNVCVLRSSEHRFGYRRRIDIWLTQDDLVNPPLMILLACIIVGHREWNRASIHLFTYSERTAVEQETSKITRMIQDGRLPISRHNLVPVVRTRGSSLDDLVQKRSASADLVILGLRKEEAEGDPSATLQRFSDLNDVLLVCAHESISIS
jgi:hypothetical protein